LTLKSIGLEGLHIETADAVARDAQEEFIVAGPQGTGFQDSRVEEHCREEREHDHREMGHLDQLFLGDSPVVKEVQGLPHQITGHRGVRETQKTNGSNQASRNGEEGIVISEGVP